MRRRRRREGGCCEGARRRRGRGGRGDRGNEGAMAVAARAAAVRTAAPIESLAAPVRIIGLGLDERVEQLSLPVSSTTSTY